MLFTETLKKNNWLDSGNNIEFKKGSWKLVFDTGSWMEVGTATNSRVFDVPVPSAGLEEWTLRLIEHLCLTAEQLAESGNQR